MKLSLFGLRLVSEREWEDVVLDRATVAYERDTLAAAIGRLLGEGTVLSETVTSFQQRNATQLAALHRVFDDLRTTNVILASRAERAEAQSERLLAQLKEAGNA